MLDRKKLKRICIKHERLVIDDDYANLLITKMILLGAKWASGDGVNPDASHRLVVPRYEPFEWGDVFGVPRTWVMVRHRHQTQWKINTKKAHQFLMWHYRGKYE